MSAIRLLILSITTAGRRGLAAAACALAALVLAPAPAGALSVAITMPDPVAVGQAGLTATVTLTNDTLQTPGTVCNVGECSGPSQGILVVPSCGVASPPGTCAAPDPGVFTVDPTATVPLGGCGANNLVTGFTVVPANAAEGSLRLVPQGGNVVLGPALSPTAACPITLTFAVASLPTIDASGAAGAQTLQSASATARFDVAGGIAEQTGAGRDETTVVPRQGPPPNPPPPNPPPPIVVPPPPPIVVPPPPPVVEPADLDHFKCYEVVQRSFRRRLVGTRDQFGQRRTRVLRTRQLCNPVRKNQGRVLQPRAHLVCYETRDIGNPTAPRTVLVRNQFGQRRLRTTRVNRLCVPSLKRRGTVTPPATPNPARVLDHFRCYDVQHQPATRTVRLADQFGATTATTVRVIRLCNPVRKNNEPVRRPRSHLVCYAIREQPPFRPLAVRVRNQFGRAALRVRRPETLCLPSFKQVLQTAAASAAPRGLDHFKCYEVDAPQLPPRFVGLRDQFGQSEGRVVATRHLCNPVRKNNGRVLNPRAHLVCYETPSVGPVPFQPRDVRVSNQFGIRQLSVVRPLTLCVPSLKRPGTVPAGTALTGPNPTRVLDHFRCYDIKPLTVARTVTLRDQFKVSKAKVRRIVRLCNPVRKNNEPVRRPQAHLVCYEIAEGTFAARPATVRNQFGQSPLRVRRPHMLCLPSLKKLVHPATGAEIGPATSGG